MKKYFYIIASYLLLQIDRGELIIHIQLGGSIGELNILYKRMLWPHN